MITIRYPRLAWFDFRTRIGDQWLDASAHWRTNRTELVINDRLPWSVEFRGGATGIDADLRAIRLDGIVVAGTAGVVQLRLGAPVGRRPHPAQGRRAEPHGHATARRGGIAPGCRWLPQRDPRRRGDLERRPDRDARRDGHPRQVRDRALRRREPGDRDDGAGPRADQASSRSTTWRRAGSRIASGTSDTLGTNDAASEFAAACCCCSSDRIPSRPSEASSSRM